MASIIARNHGIPFVLPLGTQGFVHVPAHFLHVRFRFSPFSIVIEEEVQGDDGVVKESILQLKCSNQEGFFGFFLQGTLGFTVSRFRSSQLKY